MKAGIIRRLLTLLFDRLDGRQREHTLQAYEAENVARISRFVVYSPEGPRFVSSDFRDGADVVRELDSLLATIPSNEIAFRNAYSVQGLATK